jgi:hypothetical protein
MHIAHGVLPLRRWWQAFNFISLNQFMMERGYTFFLACLYLLVTLLLVNLALAVWVANSFKNNTFRHVWPITFVRYFSVICYQVLDIATLSLLLMTMDCGYISTLKASLGYHQEFPQICELGGH